MIATIGLAAIQTAKAKSTSYTATKHAICSIFGKYCSQAIAVANCESHLSIWAHNGQYLGLFQMGYYARSRYGHSYNAWGQSRSAYRYFVDSGRDWSPWTCKPWS